MPRTKTRFVCQSCGHDAPRWTGQCPGCGDWNTMVEEFAPSSVQAPVMRVRANGGRLGGAYGGVRPQKLGDVALPAQPRLVTGLAEFDRVMGGGILRGSLTLLAGDPGIGKSTLMMELARYLTEQTVLYVTGEESAQQVKLRAQRLGIDSDSLYLFPETNIEAIMAAAQDLQPDVMIVDSIQSVYRPDLTSAPGSVAQARESTAATEEIDRAGGAVVGCQYHGARTLVVGDEGPHIGDRVNALGPAEHAVQIAGQFIDVAERAERDRVNKAVGVLDRQIG